MRFYNYNAEKSDTSFADIYLIAFVVAVVAAFLLVAAVYGLKFLTLFVMKYYLWVFGVLAGIVILRHFWTKNNNKVVADPCEYR